MESLKEESGSRGDTAILGLASLLLAASIVAFYYFADRWILPGRLAVLIAGFAVFVVLAYRTQLGKTVLDYLAGARMELRKVVWPTRQESVQTTLLIAGFVVFAALLMWGLDSALLWGVQKLTGRA